MSSAETTAPGNMRPWATDTVSLAVPTYGERRPAPRLRPARDPRRSRSGTRKGANNGIDRPQVIPERLELEGGDDIALRPSRSDTISPKTRTRRPPFLLPHKATDDRSERSRRSAHRSRAPIRGARTASRTRIRPLANRIIAINPEECQRGPAGLSVIFGCNEIGIHHHARTAPGNGFATGNSAPILHPARGVMLPCCPGQDVRPWQAPLAVSTRHHRSRRRPNPRGRN